MIDKKDKKKDLNYEKLIEELEKYQQKIAQSFSILVSKDRKWLRIDSINHTEKEYTTLMLDYDGAKILYNSIAEYLSKRDREDYMFR